jgi:ribosomal protein L16 Arg81 hydroxylase
MTGVISTAHYDGQRNFVAMLRGKKRYILAPPSACKDIDLSPRGHPSARHATFDWSDSNEINKIERNDFFNINATEVVLEAGEVLYIPSFWFHYIVSLDNSIQCNARSGNSIIGKEYISKCMHKIKK